MNAWRSPLLSISCALAMLAFAPTAPAASDWQVIKVGRWDYLSVDNIAKFYGFPGPVTPVEKTIRLQNARNQLEITLDSREAIINGVRNWLCFPVIENTDGKYLISRIDLAKTLEPQFRPHLINNLGKLKTVVIDAGHGGIEKGAASSYGLEKDFALDVAMKLKPLLEAKGLRVVMTRTGDEQVPLPQRARIANATRESIFVSIHFNATDTNPDASGFEIYSLTPRGAPSTQDNSLRSHFANMQNGTPVDAASLMLSTSVYHSMLGYMPEFDRGVKRARFAVLRLTQVPAILVEGGFLTERQESRLIAQSEWRAKLALAIAVGIENYRGLVDKKQRPMLLADYRRQLDGVLVARDGSARPPATTTSQVMPASNQQPGLLAQITAALRREPSPQIAIDAQGNAEADEDEHATGSAASSPAPAPQSQPPVEQVVAAAPPPPEEVPLSAPEAASNTPPVEQLTDPVEPDGTVAADSAPPAIAEASPVPQVVRKYWILKFNPPPKFRQ